MLLNCNGREISTLRCYNEEDHQHESRNTGCRGTHSWPGSQRRAARRREIRDGEARDSHLLRRVQDVGHPGVLQVVEVKDRLPVTDDDPSADLRRTCDNVWCQQPAAAGTLLQSTFLFFSWCSPRPDSEPGLLCLRRQSWCRRVSCGPGLLATPLRTSSSRLDWRGSLRPALGDRGDPTSCSE